jgi:CBS domain containing-hemolysin-like protein
MFNKELSAFLPIIFFIILLFFSFFLNYVSSLYSEADLFKIDLTKGRKSKRVKKLIFVLKNGHLLFAVISFLQVVINMFISIMFIERIDEGLFERVNKYFIVFVISLFIALFTEIFSRYLGTKPFSKKIILKGFFIDFAYSLVRFPFFFLKRIVKPKKKVFVNSERDVIRFINNLAAENILEKKEARLIQSAFNFDELTVNLVFTP